MKKFFYYLLFIPLFMLSNCSDNSVESKNGFQVSGHIYHNNSPVSAAQVIINQNQNLSTQTNEEGYFIITNVPEGKQIISASITLEEGNIIEQTKSIQVSYDVKINKLNLPKAIQLHEPQNVTDKSIELKWSSTDAADFREYKIYRHNSADVNESTGELVDVCTAISDTVLEVTGLEPLQTYHFRVYAMNEFGRLGGSNVLSVTTSNFQVIWNGDFEKIDPATNFARHWETDPSPDPVKKDSLIAQNGTHSAYAEINGIHNYLRQEISTTLIDPGSQYQLSYYIKIDSLCATDQIKTSFSTTNTDITILEAEPISGPQFATDWTQYTYEFTTPLTTDPNISSYQLYIGFWNHDTKTPIKVWIDNVRMIKIE